MKSLYFLPFLSAFLFYSAYTKNTGEYVTQWKIIVAVIFLAIAGAYWIYDQVRGDRR